MFFDLWTLKNVVSRFFQYVPSYYIFSSFPGTPYISKYVFSFKWLNSISAQAETVRARANLYIIITPFVRR